MAETAEIRLQLGREVFDYQQLTDCLAHLSKPRDKIAKLLAKGDIERIRKGLYVFGRLYRREALKIKPKHKDTFMRCPFALLTALLLAVPAVLHATDHLSDRPSLENSDLVYDQPAASPDAGQPIGNGRMGTMVWTSPDAIHLQINRADVFAVNRDHQGQPGQRGSHYGLLWRDRGCRRSCRRPAVCAGREVVSAATVARKRRVHDRGHGPAGAVFRFGGFRRSRHGS